MRIRIDPVNGRKVILFRFIMIYCLYCLVLVSCVSDETLISPNLLSQDSNNPLLRTGPFSDQPKKSYDYLFTLILLAPETFETYYPKLQSQLSETEKLALYTKALSTNKKTVLAYIDRNRIFDFQKLKQLISRLPTSEIDYIESWSVNFSQFVSGKPSSIQEIQTFLNYFPSELHLILRSKLFAAMLNDDELHILQWLYGQGIQLPKINNQVFPALELAISDWQPLTVRFLYESGFKSIESIQLIPGINLLFRKPTIHQQKSMVDFLYRSEALKTFQNQKTLAQALLENLYVSPIEIDEQTIQTLLQQGASFDVANEKGQSLFERLLVSEDLNSKDTARHFLQMLKLGAKIENLKHSPYYLMRDEPELEHYFLDATKNKKISDTFLKNLFDSYSFSYSIPCEKTILNLLSANIHIPDTSGILIRMAQNRCSLASLKAIFNLGAKPEPRDSQDSLLNQIAYSFNSNLEPESMREIFLYTLEISNPKHPRNELSAILNVTLKNRGVSALKSIPEIFFDRLPLESEMRQEPVLALLASELLYDKSDFSEIRKNLKYLLQKGLSRTKPDTKGKTALDYAREAKDPESIALLSS